MPSTAARTRGPGGASGAPIRHLDRGGGRRFHHMTVPLIARSQTATRRRGLERHGVSDPEQGGARTDDDLRCAVGGLCSGEGRRRGGRAKIGACGRRRRRGAREGRKQGDNARRRDRVDRRRWGQGREAGQDAGRALQAVHRRRSVRLRSPVGVIDDHDLVARAEHDRRARRGGRRDRRRQQGCEHDGERRGEERQRSAQRPMLTG